ncbi:peroxidase family protein, partial [Polaromonas sp.]|uniref:peroxidase family protein n=1 Tax=Polaromonas sp. TaxID=1869339 RepID=UPI00286B184D
MAADAGLSAPFNSWMTFFGQFFDHGLDLVTKGGSGTIFIPLQPDDPLFVPGSPTNFMVLTRATNQPGLDGILGTADDVHEQQNTTSPFVDQNQTYSSHPSHQVFLRAYELNAAGDPVATGRLITNRNLGADGNFGGTGLDADTELGGMATWAVVKAQARALLGINLTDADVSNVPLLATDPYGNFIKGPNGLPMVMMKGPDGIADTADDFLVEGNLTTPINLTNAVRTGHQFLIDIANAASPVNGQTGAALAPDADGVAGGPVAAGFYDNELLDAHYIAGDGRVNENIGLTAVHAIFHSEHNRLVQMTKDVALASNDLALLNQWLMPDAQLLALPTPAQIAGLHWNGERLFQAAKLGTEMQYQHLVFEEFARTVQPNVDAFIDFDNTINPAIVAEFAHTVYRFGHSMLTETIDRLDANFQNSEIGLIQAFLNPLAFNQLGGVTVSAEAATSAIIRGLTRQVGNEIDEFVTEAVRNNLLGLPLDLPAINIARGRDTGVPTLNAARREFYAGTGDSQLKPYISWADLVQHLKHPESVINFIAAYGTHISITSALTLADKRAAAMDLVFGTGTNPADRLDFLNSTGAYASLANGVTITGVDAIDLWIGGLAEEKMPFGGMLGSTFNFVFENQLEALQNGDRLYYLHRLAGTNFVHELENNSFAKLVMLNTDVTHLPALLFSTPTYTLEVDPSKQFNASVIAGPDGILLDNLATPVNEAADNQPGNADPIGGILLTPLVIRDNPATATADANYLQYTGEDHVVLGGTNPGSLANPSGNDILISGDGDDTLYGDGGNDRLEGGYGNDDLQGGAGDDIITDMGGDDVIKGDDGNDVIHGGNGFNLIIAGRGSDFIITGDDVTEVIAGEGNDFILGSKMNVQMAGNEGDDWIEIGTQDGAPGDNFDPLGTDSVIGNDIFVGDGTFDEMIGEGGDDIFVGSAGPDKMKGMSGFDWATYKNSQFGVNVDFFASAFNEAPVPVSMAATTTLFAQVEGLSGSASSDVLRGDNETADSIVNAGFTGSVLTNIDLITGLRAFLANSLGVAANTLTSFGAGNIILGGAGSDILEGRGGDDLIDGDKWLNVRISVRSATNPALEIDSVNSLKDLVPRMLSGEINPSQLVAVREVLTAAGPNFDTAVFSGNLADYSVVTNATSGVTTVTHQAGAGIDGTDRLTNIERLQFADGVVVLSGTNNGPAGLLTISDTTPTAFQTLTASAAGVTDADNTATAGAITGPISYYWQFEAVPGSGAFQDIVGGAGLPVSGPTFMVTPDLAGLNLRVRAVYQDANGVLETVFSAATASVAAGVAPAAAPPIPAESPTTSAGVHFIRSDLQFFLDQILIAEKHSVPGTDLGSLLPNPRMSMGLRTVDGSLNNLVQGQSQFGAADSTFPRLVPANFLNDADGDTFDPDGPGPAGPISNTDYGTAGSVADADPRTISNLIVDQTANNPAVYAAAFDPGVDGLLHTADDVLKDGVQIVKSPGLDGQFNTADDRDVFFFENVAPDAGLSAPFNSWMTFFGQFFDHGLDLVTKGGNGTIFIP